MRFLLLFFLQISLFAQTPLAYYPMDVKPRDESGNNNHGQIWGGVTPTMDRFGNPCGALLFNGTDGYVEIPSSQSLKSPSNGFSATAWFKISSASCMSDIRWLTLVCKGERSTESDNNPQYRFQTLQASNQSTISINTDFTEFDDNYQQHGFGYDIWHFYALTYDGYSVKAFLNGSKIWEFPYNKSFSANDSPLFIGKDIPGSLEYFCGALDDVRIFNSALSDTQLSNYYHEPNRTPLSEDFTFSCLPNSLVNTEKGKCSAVVNFNQPIVSIQCGNVDLKQIKGLPSGSFFLIGNNSIVFEATSSSGIVKTCYSSIAVQDKEAPKITCRPDTTITLDQNQKEAIVHYLLPIASDNCTIASLKLKTGLASGSPFVLGTTTNVFEAIDVAGNVAQCSFKVHVLPDVRITPKAVKLDTLVIPKSVIVKDSVRQAYNLAFNDCVMTLVLYDDVEQDNDTVSIFFNGKEIIKRELITLKENEPLNKAIMLNQDETNELIVKAWNTGKVSPNTLKIEFHEGYWVNDPKKLKKHKPATSRIINSRPGMSSRVTLKCKSK